MTCAFWKQSALAYKQPYASPKNRRPSKPRQDRKRRDSRGRETPACELHDSASQTLTVLGMSLTQLADKTVVGVYFSSPAAGSDPYVPDSASIARHLSSARPLQ